MERKSKSLLGAVLALALLTGMAQGQEAPSPGVDEWSSTVLPQPAGEALVVGVAVGPESMVAVGQRVCDRMTADTARCWGQAWTSADGVTWQAANPRASGLALGRSYPVFSGPEVGLQGVAYGPAGFLAYGRIGTGDTLGQGSAVWRSADGRSWERLTDTTAFPQKARLRTILGTDDGYLLGGVIYYEKAPRAAIWSSPDGQTWTRARSTADDQTFEIGGYIDTMEDPGSGGVDAFALYPGSTDSTASMANGVVAVGQACMPSFDEDPWAWNGACWGQVWSSSDGLTWRKDEGTRPRPFGAISHAAALADRLLLGAPICHDGCADALLWADDGTSLRVAYGSPVDGQLEGLVAQAGRFRALLAAEGEGASSQLALWVSGDGTNWTREDAQPELPVSVRFHDVDMAIAGERLVVTVSGEAAPDGDFISLALLSPPLP